MRNIHRSRPISSVFEGQRVILSKLNMCPVCDALNPEKNVECHVCGWTGQFIRDEYSIELSLLAMLDQCPELIELLVEQPPSKKSFLKKLHYWYKKSWLLKFSLNKNTR